MKLIKSKSYQANILKIVSDLFKYSDEKVKSKEKTVDTKSEE
jgi:hypothetical protein